MRIPLAILLLSLYAPLHASGVEHAVDFKHLLVEATDLTADGKIAARRKLPILLLVSQDHCPFCDRIKREILGPMVVSREYDNKLLIREIYIDLGSQVVDFHGKVRDSSSFMLDYNVFLTPTLLFLDDKGNELTERMVGLQTPEMYPFYVDRAVERALAAYRGKG